MREIKMSLIAHSNILSLEEKRVMMKVLTQKLRKSQYSIDSEDARMLVERAKEVLDAKTISIGKKGNDGDEDKHLDGDKGISSAQMLEDLVCELIESFT